MLTSLFYRKLKSFSDFNDLTNNDHFEVVPSDWSVVITDIKGSTKAIELGRYKDVNTIGAASISVVQNVLNVDFPFVFGGDGASMLIPPGSKKVVIEALSSLKKLAKDEFDLNLRVGSISISELNQQGQNIQIAKHEITHGKYVAVFRDGGLAFAENKIKEKNSRYLHSDKNIKPLNLDGLSCRWNQVPSKKGKVLSVIIKTQPGSSEKNYPGFLNYLNNLFGNNINDANPVNTELMEFKSFSECVKDEKRYHTNKWSKKYFVRLIEIMVSVLVFKYHIPPLIFNPLRYKQSMRIHSDYKKFDDLLRMVIDCSEEQAKDLKKYLKARYEEGEIFYGIQEAKESHITCYIKGMKDGHHIHFIDGGNGGYAIAAKQLKEQQQLCVDRMSA